MPYYAWDPVVELLTGRWVVRMDRPGLAGTPWPGRLPTLAEEIATLEDLVTSLEPAGGPGPDGPPKGAVLPGGNGVAFDWTLLAGLARPSLCMSLGMGAPGFDPDRDIMLSGGLTPENVGEAIRVSGLRAVDVSSGVESAPGIKDDGKIAAFIQAARVAFAASESIRRMA